MQKFYLKWQWKMNSNRRSQRKKREKKWTYAKKGTERCLPRCSAGRSDKEWTGECLPDDFGRRRRRRTPGLGLEYREDGLQVWRASGDEDAGTRRGRRNTSRLCAASWLLEKNSNWTEIFNNNQSSVWILFFFSAFCIFLLEAVLCLFFLVFFSCVSMVYL